MIHDHVSSRVGRALAALAVVLAALAAASSAAGAAAARHAVVVVIDGARYSETLGDPRASWCPRQQRELAPLGCVVPDFRNEGLTLTIPGTSAILTGSWQALRNDGTERSDVPTVFETWRAATGAPASDTWIVTSKGKIASLDRSDHPAGGAAFMASTAITDSDPAALDAAMQVLARYHPTLMALHLGGTDLAAHSGSWLAYTATLRQADSLVGVLWRAIQADTALAGRTALFVANDHGRHDDAHGGFRGHGDGCEGCRHVELLALGAGMRRGFTAAASHRQIDIVPTLGALLGFATPWASGVPMSELFAEPAGTGNPSAPGTNGLRLLPPQSRPSGESVRLTVEVPRSGRLSVIVCDAQGRRVATLFAGTAPAGPITLRWNGRDARGRRVPAGSYAVRADDGRTSVTQSVQRVR